VRHLIGGDGEAHLERVAQDARLEIDDRLVDLALEFDDVDARGERAGDAGMP
jgi:hypothetical protein